MREVNGFNVARINEPGDEAQMFARVQPAKRLRRRFLFLFFLSSFLVLTWEPSKEEEKNTFRDKRLKVVSVETRMKIQP